MDKLLLSGKWDLSGAGIECAGTVPGDIVDDLFNAGRVPDPYYNDNHKELDWVHNGDWTYSREFTLDAEADCSVLRLCLDGVDTFSDVYINEQLVLETDNMHYGYKVDIKPYTRRGKNKIEIRLKSTLKRLALIDNKEYLCIFNKDRLFIRKAQCHFGWDWAPAFPGYGVYRDVYILYGASQYIKDLTVTGSVDGSVQCNLTLSEKLSVGSKAVLKIFSAPNTSEGKYEAVISRQNRKKHILNIRLTQPQLWWPNGYGEQNLYYYAVEIEWNGIVTDRREGWLGLRSLELCQDALDAETRDFLFKINGRRIFCRGGNWVPADCMTGRIKKERYTELLRLARDAGINMLRVWGGGIYESDVFYEKCDEYGIMVWQDFMFACSDVPDDDENIKIYTREVEYQVKRLCGHVCLTYWCGVNERPGAFSEYEFKKDNFFLEYVLRGICTRFSPQIPFGIASPIGYTDIDNDFSSGDAHTNITKYAVNNGTLKTFWKDFDKTKNNFSSECAVIGCCRYKSLIKFIPPGRLYVNDKIFAERFMGNPYEGCDEMHTFIGMEVKMATALFGAPTDFQDFVKKSSLVQSDILEAEIKYARTNGRCNGLLNWMYNDIWPIGTWAVVDYYLTPKPAYYAMKRAFSPVLTAIVRDGSGMYIRLVNNGTEKVMGLLKYGCTSYDGIEVNEAPPVKVELQMDESLSIPIDAPGNMPVAYCRYMTDSGEYADICDTKKYDGYQPGTVKLCGFESADYGALLEVEAVGFCRSVFIDSGNEDERLSDNFFDLLPGEKRKVRIISAKPVSKESLTVYAFGDRWDR